MKKNGGIWRGNGVRRGLSRNRGSWKKKVRRGERVKWRRKKERGRKRVGCVTAIAIVTRCRHPLESAPFSCNWTCVPGRHRDGYHGFATAALIKFLRFLANTSPLFDSTTKKRAHGASRKALV